MDGNRAANANGNAVLFFLKRKHLSKATHVHPLFTGKLRIGFSIFDPCRRRSCALAQAFETIVAAVVRLYKDRIPHILHSVAYFSLDAYVRNFPDAVIIHSWAISVQRVAIPICFCHRYQCQKVDLMLQCRHVYSSSFSSLVSFFSKNVFLCSSYPIK